MIYKTTFAGQLPDGWLVHAQALPDDKAIISGDLFDSLGVNGQPYTIQTLLLVDSLGNIEWQRGYDPHWSNSLGGLATRPAGVVALGTRSRQFTPTVRTNQGVVRYVDLHGRLRWEQIVGAPFSIGGGVAALPDGSYVTVMNDPSHRPGIQNYWTFDLKLNRFSPTGQRLDSTWVGRAGEYDWAYQVQPTTDGGLVIVGKNDEDLPNTPERSVLYKLDSTWHEEWRVVESAPGTTSATSGDWHWVQEMRRGRFMVGGSFSTLIGLGLVAPPPAAADTVGTVLWRSLINWRNISPVAVFFEPDGTGQLVGLNCNGYPSHAYFAGLAGLGTPAAVDLCATPPPVPHPSVGQLLGNTLPFALDSATTGAGPRYAVIDNVTWDFGDGSAPATGWSVRHAFASPAPVRVRCCVSNNLFCQRCADLYPFGPLGTAAADADNADAAGSVFPDPAGEGRFLVRSATPPAALTVFDAVGRVVWAAGCPQACPTAETALDLRPYASGVYQLRMRWASGRTRTLRLLR